MSQYRKIRAQDPDSTQEVEYNFGRLFHQIGWPFLCGAGDKLTHQRFILARCKTLREGVGDRREEGWCPRGVYSFVAGWSGCELIPYTGRWGRKRSRVQPVYDLCPYGCECAGTKPVPAMAVDLSHLVVEVQFPSKTPTTVLRYGWDGSREY